MEKSVKEKIYPGVSSNKNKSLKKLQKNPFFLCLSHWRGTKRQGRVHARTSKRGRNSLVKDNETEEKRDRQESNIKGQ